MIPGQTVTEFDFSLLHLLLVPFLISGQYHEEPIFFLFAEKVKASGLLYSKWKYSFTNCTSSADEEIKLTDSVLLFKLFD